MSVGTNAPTLALLAEKLCTALSPYHTPEGRLSKPAAAVILAAPPDGLRSLKLGSLLMLPLHKGGRPLGVVVLAERSKGSGAWSHRSLEQLQVSLALLIEQTAHLEKIDLYSKVANFDGLTGLHTHRYFQETLAKEIDRAQRLGHPVSVMMIDIDHFKQYNDSFGHPQGDVALKAIARILQKSVRSYDLAARYGGEEMVLVLPEVSPHRILPLAERIRIAVAKLPLRVGPDAQRVRAFRLRLGQEPAHESPPALEISAHPQALKRTRLGAVARDADHVDVGPR